MGFLALSLLLLSTSTLQTSPLQASPPQAPTLLSSLPTPILFRGDNHTAYRDPLLIHENGTFHMFYSYVLEEEDHLIYWYAAHSTSTDLKNWSPPRPLTPKDQNLNYASPGSIVRDPLTNDHILCLQTYPIVNFRRGDKLRFADDRARLYTMRSPDLATWTTPEPILVKGPAIPLAAQGKMIDPFIMPDKDTPGKWWCFYKQDGKVHSSTSTDALKTWTPAKTSIATGENPCVIVKDGEYIMFYSPKNGIGVKRSPDLVHWRETAPPITLGQGTPGWRWAETRLTAGYVADMRHIPGVGKYLMVYHASGPGKIRTELQENANAHIAIAWSDDLATWDWPGRKRTPAELAKRPNPGPDVLVVADATTTADTDDDDPKLEFPRPAPGAPVYYFYMGQKEKTVGPAWAGEKFPPKATIDAEVIKSLDTQGYKRTQVGGPKPALVIMAMWGTAAAIANDSGDFDTTTTTTDDDPGNGMNLPNSPNARQMAKIVGAHKAADRNFSDPFEADQTRQSMSDDRVYLMIGAFDAGALARRERKLVWRTTVSIDTLAYSFPASLATMLSSAAPYFGRNTDKALLIDDQVRKATVELGELTVVPDPPPPAQPKN